MNSLNQSIYEYSKLVKNGELRLAYQGLMAFIRGLRVYFKDHYPAYGVAGDIYQGNMDITFFSLSPKAFKHRDLKLAIVFIHEEMAFELWLTGRNAEIQRKYRASLRKHRFNQYAVSNDEKGISSIIEYPFLKNPNFDDLADLTKQIEAGVMAFIKDIEGLLD